MKYILKLVLLALVSFSYAQEERYEVELAEFNSTVSDFGPSYTEDGLIFASERDTLSFSNRRHRINGKLRPYLQLFSVTREGDSMANVNRLKTVVNKKYHESTVALSNDGNTMYFTRNNFFQSKFKKDTSGINLLKVFKSTKQENGSWGAVEELPFNNNNYSVAHPSLNADNSRLYFASDMPGTLGKSDIWYVSINNDGSYGDPVNMGSTINTSGADTFPFIAKSGDLYFSSDTHPGNGGLDLFVAKVDEDYKVIHHLGNTINTSSDDFSLIFNESDRTGYFSSNREDGMGDDDIYKFKELAPLVVKCEGTISGLVKDTEGNVLSGVLVVLTDDKGNELISKSSDASGYYSFDIDCKDKIYAVRGTKTDYEQKEKTVATSIDNKNSKADLTLMKIEKAAAVGVDLAKELGLNPIYFDTNKSVIRPDAAIELQKVIAYMKEHPTVKVEVRSHTDSRGKKSSNLNLSDRRAKSTARYITEKGGISSDRISGKGFGETQLLNRCSDGVKCSKTEHQLNRRSEFIIISK